MKEDGDGSKPLQRAHHLPHVEQVVHDSNPMEHSNAFGGVAADQRLGSTGTATSVPDVTSVSPVIPRHLKELRIEI